MTVLNSLLVLSIIGSTITPALAENNEAVPLAATKPLARYYQINSGINLEVKQYPLVGEPSKSSKKKRIRKTSKAFYPVELEISNTNTQELYIAPEMMDVKLMKLDNVASQMTKSNAVRNALVGGGVAGALVGGAAATVTVGCTGAFFVLGPMVLAGFVAVVGGVAAGIGLLIGAPIGISRYNRLYNQNKEILEERVLYDTFVIKPGETLSKLVFINEFDYQNSFKMRVENENNQSIIFDVKLAPKPSLA